MNLQSFFSVLETSAITNQSLILVAAEEYPALFFALLCDRIRKNCTPILKKVSFEGVAFASLQAQFSTTFLGRQDFLWLGDISSIEESSLKKQLLSFLATYKGPHTLFAFVKSSDWKSTAYSPLVLEEPLSESDKRIIINFFLPAADKNRVADLIKMIPKVSLDQLMILIQYQPLLGKNSAEFKEQWVGKLLGLEQSLFELSTYFFARKTVLFWKIWDQLKEEYPPAFWTSYWSEQLCRAAMMVAAYQNNNIVEGKQFAYRLPFSFIQRDWKLHSFDSLSRAHTFLYEGDCSLKNGNSSFFLDLFYTAFFTKHF